MKGAEIGIIARTLSSYFPVSEKKIKRTLLEAQKQASTHNNYLFSFHLKGETILPNTFPGEPIDYGVAVPLEGNEKTNSAVVISLNQFVRIGRLYIKRKKYIPALNLEGRLIEVCSVDNDKLYSSR